VKQENALSSLPFTPALCVTRNVKERQERFWLNETHQLLFYAGDVNLFGDNISNVKKNKVDLLVASNEVGLELNAKKPKLYIYIYIYTFLL